MKPIETIYKGYRFRSRLEARWAVFFDAIDVRWEYEPEGYELSDRTWYLPDFRIYVRHRSCTDEYEPVYVEVKGMLSDEDEHKVDRFFRDGAPIIILGGIPENNDEYNCQFSRDCRFNSFNYIDGDSYCAYFSMCDGEVWLSGADHDTYDEGKLLDWALPIARGARFEHGEVPA